MSEAIYLYLDGSGNLGSSGRYFVIAGIETPNSKPLHNVMKKSILKIKTTYDRFKASQEIKASDSSPIIKDFVLRKIATKENIHIRYIVADKKHVKRALIEDENLLYNFLLKFLILPIATKPNLKKFVLILDKRTIKVKSSNSFEDYINILLRYEIGLDIQIEVMYMESHNCYAIQAADFIANALYLKYEFRNPIFESIIASQIIFADHFPRGIFGK